MFSLTNYLGRPYSPKRLRYGNPKVSLHHEFQKSGVQKHIPLNHAAADPKLALAGDAELLAGAVRLEASQQAQMHCIDWQGTEGTTCSKTTICLVGHN